MNMMFIEFVKQEAMPLARLRAAIRRQNKVLVGAIEPLPPVHGGLLAMRNRSLAGSLIGGLPETQEMLDFCGEHGIHPEIETIRIDEVNEAYDRLVRGDVRYRFVIDMEASRP